MKTMIVEKKYLIGYSSTLGGTLSSDCLACNSMRFKDVRRQRSLALKSSSDVWVSYISDSSNIGCVGILTFIYMLNALHISSSFMLKCNARYWLLFETVMLLLEVSFSKIPKYFFFHHICSTLSILQLKLFLYFVWVQKHASDFRNHLIM